MKLLKELAGFIFVSLLSCLAVFQDAMWGRSIVAPIDIAPALWAHYKHVDPAQGAIPQNHYIVDQLSYDLPLQHLMYHAWRQGEVPLWNPYTLNGRPLLADAHCNGTDPIRLAVYFAVPDFVLAYNWTLILHCLATGITFYVLLRGIGARFWVAGFCALAAQWAGGYVLYIGHPWVRSSFLYYPLLWLAWHFAFNKNRFSHAAPLLVAAIFYSGNLQSHAYLPFFFLAFAFGYAGRNRTDWRRVIKVGVPSLLLGTLLASPILVPQVELYLHSVRPVGESPKLYWLETIAVLTGFHPWAAGTFRTISIRSVNAGTSFHLALGGTVLVLAVYGWFSRNRLNAPTRALATGGGLVFLFLLIVLTPLQPILYLRAAGLAIIGLAVLAASGAERLLESSAIEKQWNRVTWALVAVATFGTAILAHTVYPSFRPKIETMLLEHARNDGYGGATRELRKFQAANFTSEVSPTNPEAALNLFAMALLATAFVGRGAVQFRLGCAVVVSLLPLLMFSERFIARSRIEMWHRLLKGGPAQRQVIAQYSTANARFQDEAAQCYLRLFPQEIAVLHRLHVTHGYAALQRAAP